MFKEIGKLDSDESNNNNYYYLNGTVKTSDYGDEETYYYYDGTAVSSSYESSGDKPFVDYTTDSLPPATADLTRSCNYDEQPHQWKNLMIFNFIALYIMPVSVSPGFIAVRLSCCFRDSLQLHHLVLTF